MESGLCVCMWVLRMWQWHNIRCQLWQHQTRIIAICLTVTTATWNKRMKMCAKTTVHKIATFFSKRERKGGNERNAFQGNWKSCREKAKERDIFRLFIRSLRLMSSHLDLQLTYVWALKPYRCNVCSAHSGALWIVKKRVRTTERDVVATVFQRAQKMKRSQKLTRKWGK